MPSVAICGGGVGGLSAAHELAERGFDVAVFDANERFGGKARSMPVSDGPQPLHGEHGFRFFPAFYRHVTDTMARIPDGDGTVEDNLVGTEETLIAASGAPGRRVQTANPETPGEWLEALRPAFAEELPPQDVQFICERLLYILTACDERRERELEHVSWWEFVDAENRSEAFRERLAYATQALVALRPELGSARTIGTIYLQLLFGQLDPRYDTERILNGPTSEIWIDPWVAYLESLGVEFHPETPVTGVEFDGERITGAQLATGHVARADEYVLAVPVEVAPEFVTPELARAAPELRGISNLDTAWMNGIQYYLSEDVTISRGHQIYADSPWALTSISQRQFWPEYDLENRGPDEVEGVLSVIASDWDTPGIVFGKPARACTRAEITEEIWAQLNTHLNAVEPTLTDDLLVDSVLDPSIVETDDGVENRSPLLINTVGSLTHRPPADVGVENLTLASDYVRTHSDLASMESANEAGRRAANAICARHGRPADADVWPLREPGVFEPLRRHDRLQYRLGVPHPAAVSHSLRTAGGRLASAVGFSLE